MFEEIRFFNSHHIFKIFKVIYMHDKIQKQIFQGRYSKKNQLTNNCKT